MGIDKVLRQATRSIEWTFDKFMNVFETKEAVNDNGADTVSFELVQMNIPCRISVQRLENTTMVHQANQVGTTHKVFYPADCVVKVGSKLLIDGVKYEAVEEPMVYVTHCEVVVHKHEWV